MKDLSSLNLSEAEAFVDARVKELISYIELDENDYINVNRVLMKEGHSIFHHDIYVCPSEQIIGLDIWEDSEMFEKNGSNLYLYLKGRMLIQTTTTWTVYKGCPFEKQYKVTCDYLIKEEV